MHRDELIQILLRTVDSPPSSYGAANELEAVFLAIVPEIPEVEEFMVALASYEPTVNPSEYMNGFDSLRSEARSALHDLDVHDYCIHDIPLADRP